MNARNIPALKDCYVMQRDDVERFADTLADGFSQYRLFRYVCNDRYNHSKMSRFWAVSIALYSENAVCIADSKEANSVLIYIPPKCKEPDTVSYLSAGILKMGLRRLFRMLYFKAKVQKVAERYKTADDGYLLAFATRLDKQGQHYGKPLMAAFLRYLDAVGEGCYLETFKPENVGFYEHFEFQLKGQVPVEAGNLTLYAMHRQPANEKTMQ